MDMNKIYLTGHVDFEGSWENIVALFEIIVRLEIKFHKTY